MIATGSSARRWISIASIACMLPAAVWAGPERAEQDQDARGRASEHFQRGVGLAEAGDYRQAVAEFKRAYDIVPEPEVLYNVGQAHLALGESVEAVRALGRYLQLAGPHIPSERRERVNSQLETLNEAVAWLRFQVSPERARLFIDEIEVENNALIVLPPGTHHVRTVLAGRRPHEATVELNGGTTTVLAVSLQQSDEGSEGLLSPPEERNRRDGARPPGGSHVGPVQVASDPERSLAYALGGGGMALGLIAAGAYAWNEMRYQELVDERERLRQYDGRPVPPSIAERQAEVVGSSRSISEFQVVWVGTGIGSVALLVTAGYMLLAADTQEDNPTSLKLGPGGGQLEVAF